MFVFFIRANGCTVIENGYDYMGRRYMKKVTVNGTVVLHQHYLYRGYLQIAALDLTRSNAPALWYLHWDPTQPVATRPLSLRKNGTWYTYGHDLTKNVMELYKADGTIATAYDYTPYGSVTASGIDQPIQWSSEHYDAELALVYYNYRHYNPADGRWINRDPIAERGGYNLYGFVNNNPFKYIDIYGLRMKKEDGAQNIRDFLIFMHKMCEECCDVETASCKAEATNIINNLARAWEDNYGKGPHKRGGDPVGGYFCWDWANKFYQEIQSLNTKVWLVKFRMFYNPNCQIVMPDGSVQKYNGYHFAVNVYIKTPKINASEKCNKGVNFDDSYFEGGCAHDGDWPQRKDYTEVAMDPNPFTNNEPAMREVRDKIITF